jgi:hypothetical protein
MFLNRNTTDRVQRLKDARAEATKDIEEYKRAKEQEFLAFEASVRWRMQVVIRCSLTAL